MDYWILDNLEKLVPVVIALIYFLGSSKSKKRAEEAERRDPAAEDRARKIQEEIRRKIIERQRGGSPSPSAEPEPPAILFEEDPEPEVVRPFEREAPRTEEFPRSSQPVELFEAKDPFEEKRKQIEEQLRKARELAAKTDQSDAYDRPVSSKRQAVLDHRHRDDLLSGLRNSASIRNAIVLKEILDPPVSMRQE